jgi:hypothetical protein
MDSFIEMTSLIPDYIKIDVDGAEQSIISGMSETIKNQRLKSVLVEVSETSEPFITRFFDKADFKIDFERIFEGEETIFKNIIFTRR